MVVQGVDIAVECRGAISLDQRAQPFLGNVAGRDLRTHVTENLDRRARIRLENAKHGVDRLAPLIEFDQRQPQALLLDFRRIDRDATGHDAAEIGVVRHRRGEACEPAVNEDGL